MSFVPTSSGTVTFTPLVPGTKIMSAPVNTIFGTFTDRLNSLTTDINAVAGSLSQSIQGSSNAVGSVTQVTALLGGVAAGVWPSVSYTFTADTVTGFKVSRDFFFYYQFEIETSTKQPVMRMSTARTLVIAKAAYYRDNVTPTASECTISVRKNNSEVGQIRILASDANQTWINQAANFAANVNFAKDDFLSLVVTAVPGSGTAAQDISILLPFEELVRVK